MDLSMVVIYIVLLAMGYKVINNTAFNDVVNKDPVLSKMVPKHENKKEATKDQIQKIINLNIHGITTILQNFLRAERCALLGQDTNGAMRIVKKMREAVINHIKSRILANTPTQHPRLRDESGGEMVATHKQLQMFQDQLKKDTQKFTHSLTRSYEETSA